MLAVLLLGAAGFLLAWPASSPADTTEAAVTPHNDTAAIFDVLSHKRAFATDRATLTLIEHTLESEHYDVRWYGKGGNAGPATLANFVKTVRAGVDIIDTHGTPDSLLVQQYATADAAQQGLAGYVRAYGAGSRSWFVPLQKDHGLWLDADGISHFFAEQARRPDLIFNISCGGWHLFPDFAALAYFGYFTSSKCSDASSDAQKLFDRLAGKSGVENRTTVGAYGLGGFVHEGFLQKLRLHSVHPVVLSPAVESADASAVPGSTTQGTVQFDATMDDKDPTGALKVSGCGASLSDEKWDDDSSRLTFHLKLPAATSGTLKLTVGSRTARATPGGYSNDWLDGNQSPSPDNGVAPNGTDYEWQLPCGGGQITATYAGSWDQTDTVDYTTLGESTTADIDFTYTETEVVNAQSALVISQNLQVNGSESITSTYLPQQNCTAQLSAAPPAGPSNPIYYSRLEEDDGEITASPYLPGIGDIVSNGSGDCAAAVPDDLDNSDQWTTAVHPTLMFPASQGTDTIPYPVDYSGVGIQGSGGMETDTVNATNTLTVTTSS